MSSETEKAQEIDHRKIAASLFNKTWDLLEKGRNSDEDDLMISMSHASLYHWKVVGGKKQEATGNWIISRVYSTLKMPESAIYHGERCLKITETSNLGSFDLGFAYESLSRAYLVSGNKEVSSKYLKLALDQCSLLKEKEDKEWLETNLKQIKAFLD